MWDGLPHGTYEYPEMAEEVRDSLSYLNPNSFFAIYDVNHFKLGENYDPDLPLDLCAEVSKEESL